MAVCASSIADQVRELLRLSGPLTTGEVAAHLGITLQRASRTMCDLRRAVNRPVHICGWTYDGIGRTYLRAEYSIGPGRNAKKPSPSSNAAKCKTQRVRVRRRICSVFQLGNL